MSYIKTGAAHTNQLIEDQYGNEQTRYGRYETGFIEGEYRDMLALIADETGFDGLGFDANAGSNDDSWHVVNLFEDGGHYVDTVAIGGALDEDHALTLANTQFDYLGADYGVLVGYADDMQFDHMTDDQAWSIDAISKLLNNPSQDKHYLPIITSKELYTEATRATFNDAQWDKLNLSSHGGKLTNLYTDMRRADTFRELTQEFDLQQALIDIEAEEAEFDSIMDTVNRLPILKDRLFRAMSQASNETLSVTNVTQTKPFKRGGVVNVAFVFDLSDGQKLSIWFHNPDSTPSKLLAGDLMVSWKWLLNKRDVTAILSPLNGQAVKIPTLARQMMLLASKNSKNFKRAQERKAKRDADINKAKETIEEKKQTIEQLDKDIESLKDQIDEAMKANKGKANKDTTAVEQNNELPEPNIQVASNGMRYEPKADTDAGEAIKIYMYSKNDDHWLVYHKDDGRFTVYANNAQSRASSGGFGGGYGMPKPFENKSELFEKYPKFQTVLEEAGIVKSKDFDKEQEADTANENKLTKLPDDKRKAIENLFSDIKMGKQSDELLASMLAIFNHADKPLSDKDKGLIVGAAARLFDLKELNSYYLDKENGLSENGIKAYNNALATLNSLKLSDMVDYLFRQDVEYPPINTDGSDDNKQVSQEAMASVSEIIRSDKTKEEKAELILQKIKHINSIIDDKNIKIDKNAIYYKEARRESENYGGLEPNFWVRNGYKKPSAKMDYGLALAEAQGALYFLEQDKQALSESISNIKDFAEGKAGYKGVADYPADAYRKVESLESGDWVALPTAINANEVTIYFKSPLGNVETVVADGIEKAWMDMRTAFFDLLDQKELEEEKDSTKQNIIKAFGKPLDELIDEYYEDAQKNLKRAKRSGNPEVVKEYEKALRSKRNKVWDFEEAISNYADGKISKDQLLNGPAGELPTVKNAVASDAQNTQKDNDVQTTNAAYSQEDIDYLQSIVNGDLDFENVDMDRVIEIGEKDENDPLYAQALDIVLEAVDKASSNL